MRDQSKPVIGLRDLPPRADGYVDLRSYAAIGNGRAIAMVAHDGSIDWYATPDLDSAPAFARLLDAESGGCIELQPSVDFVVSREFIPGTNVLQTTYTTDRGRVRVTDSLNIGLGEQLPWGELARQVEGLEGEVPMQWRVSPGTCLGSVSPWVQHTEHGPVLRVGKLTLGIRGSNHGECCNGDQQVAGSFDARAGSEHLLAIVSTYDEPLQLPDPRSISAGTERTVDYWQSWSAAIDYDGPWADHVLRSALTLKLLTHGPSGAIAAAATTSLPESRQGGKNWDYRFAWLRDATYTLHALMRLGQREDVHAEVSWLLRVARKQGGEPPVMADFDGERPAGESHLDVPGWRGIGPVAVGNRAVDQLQLGVYGDLFDMARLYVDGGNVLDVATGRMLADVADKACDVWQQPDAGMWELLEIRHYTSSKMGCWHALNCAVRLAEAGQIPGSADRWRQERDRIEAWIEQNCWSAEVGSYVWYPGSTRLDASVLLHAITGFDRGDRMSSTIDALRRELGQGSLLYRFSGAEGTEATFVACAFWMVAALATVGRRDEAVQLMDDLVLHANDVGQFTEMIDGVDHSFWGNSPQALSHLALLTAALTVDQDY